MKTWILAALLFVPPSARAVDAKKAAPAAGKAQLRAALRLAYAKAFSLSEVLIGVDKGYSMACADEHAAPLMMIEMILAPSLETKKSIAGNLEAAVAAATRDAAAQETAVALVEELNAVPSLVAKLSAKAKRCVDFVAKKSAEDSSEADLFKWDGPRMHAGENMTLLSGLDVSAELKAAQALVEKTK